MNSAIKEYFSDRRENPSNVSFTDVPCDNQVVKRSSTLPWVELKGLKVPFREIFNEYLLAGEKIKFYHHPRGPLNKGWMVHTLYGYGEDKTLSYLEYRDINPKNRHWSAALEYLPKTLEFIRSLPYSQVYDVRFLLLKPGGYIHPHTDMPRMCLDPLNIPIHFPENCFFKFRKFGYVPMVNGRAFVINIGYEHGVWNLSDEPRLCLCIYGKKNSDFYQRLV